MIIAFIGKRQWAQLFEPVLPRVDGLVQAEMPPRWPFGRDECTVYVLNSPSGRNAAVTPAGRLAEYAELAAAIERVEWPRVAEGDAGGAAEAE